MDRRADNARDGDEKKEVAGWKKRHVHPLFKYNPKIKDYINTYAIGEGNVGIGKKYLDENIPEVYSRATTSGFGNGKFDRTWKKHETQL